MLSIKPKELCVYDEISLGEVMLRLDPMDDRVRTAQFFRCCEGGGEYNVARGLAKCFKKKTAVITALPENDIGYLIEDFIHRGNVDTAFIKWYKYDGIGRTVRAGLNFTERGFGVRGAAGTSDRANSAASLLSPGDIDWDHIFGDIGCRFFHTGGIYAALSETSADTALMAVKSAKKHGVTVSYDLNYRPSLWQYNGGFENARRVNKQIVRYADILIGNEEDYNACLGFETGSLNELSEDSYKQMLKNLSAEYPGLTVAAVTMRGVKTANINSWTAMCIYDNEIYEGLKFPELDIYDRVGGGDSFASGFIYGLMEQKDITEALNYGICHGALAMTTPGDTSKAGQNEVEALMRGQGARVIR